LANIQSQIKRNRQNEKRRLRNRDFRGAARSAVRDALSAMAAGQDAQTAVTRALSILDRAARKGAIHHRNAARRKGRLVKRFAALGQSPAAISAQPAAETGRGASTAVKAPAAVAEPKPKAAAKKAAPKTRAKKTPAKKTTKK
jgi:small subunit ribosomal protein S20